MANPRQRRKRKSGHASVSHSRRAKRLLKKMPTIHGPKALQDAWDKAKTVRQNYLALGLQHSLNPVSSGGSEVDLRCGRPDRVKTEVPSSHEGEKDSGGRSSVKKVVPSGFGRIVRDETGVVIGVELGEEEEEERGPGPDMEALEPSVADADRQVWAQGGTGNDDVTSSAERTRSAVIRRLERLSAHTETRVRHTSQGERMYIVRLARKYGDDYEKMARDRRLNAEQKTVGQLKRAVEKAGGLAELCRD
ncbi:ribosome biogenesis protein Nop16 [Pisolithus croceorrhizus]|nr:ribosome biogenesis protein Nop16 [Pisolithus croceorrhizus]KAI6164347.1 ribosome biogenesis protein Nop16 [Pisolithus thermaeus]